MKSAKIIVCCHKQDIMATAYPYIPVHVGKALSNIDLGIQTDNEGVNISEKNRSYCELTGLYWAWKNIGDADVVGLAHYRRYFDFHDQCDSVFPVTSFPSKEFNQVDLSIPQSVIESLHDGEAYVAKANCYRYSPFVDYCICHISDDIHTLEKHIMTTQPENIKKAWYKYMHGGCQFRPCNMFLMTHHDFDRYCEWIFSVLDTIEQQIDITHYSPVQGRIFGYMAERLMNVWLLANEFQLHEKPVILFDDNCARTVSRSTVSHLNYYLNLLRCKLAITLERKKYSTFIKYWEHHNV